MARRRAPLSRADRRLLWFMLVAMLLTTLSQVGDSFDRPFKVIVGCCSGTLAVVIAITLFVGRGTPG